MFVRFLSLCFWHTTTQCLVFAANDEIGNGPQQPANPFLRHAWFMPTLCFDLCMPTLLLNKNVWRLVNLHEAKCMKLRVVVGDIDLPSDMSTCRHIKVDEYSKTNIDSIYAIGDVTNRMALTPVALMEGGALAKTLFNDQPTKPDHKFVATAVFSQPHIGTCGLSEEEAVEEHGDVDVYTASFKPMRSGFIGSDMRALYKIVVDHKTDRVLGMHLIGPDSGEIMQVRLLGSSI
jgi:hypothetical protein